MSADDMNPSLAQILRDTSPQMFLNGRAALMRYHDSPTGWIVVHPGSPWPSCPNPLCLEQRPHEHYAEPDPRGEQYGSVIGTRILG